MCQRGEVKRGEVKRRDMQVGAARDMRGIRGDMQGDKRRYAGG